MADDDNDDVPTGELQIGGVVIIAVLVAVVLAALFGAVLPAEGDSGDSRSGLAWVLSASQPPTVTLEGLDDGDTLGDPELERATAVLRTDDPDALDDAVVTLGGERIPADFDDEGELHLPLGGLSDGEHQLTVRREESWRTAEVDERWTFSVDTEPPRLDVDSLEVAVGDEPLPVSGRTDSDAEVEVNGQPGTVEGDGAFTVDLDGSQAESVEVRATDPVGNTAMVETATAWVPSRSEVDQINAMHVSIWGWSSDQLREPILRMAEEGRINTVQLDLKDEGGHIAYDTDVPLANEIGANLDAWDLEEAVAELHARGVRVVGRIVAFADPVLSEHAWNNGMRDLVLQRPRGTMYTGKYSGFTSFAHETVRQYHYDLAEEAVRAGVDDILWDYIRRPGGPEEEYYFGGLDEDTTPEESVASFLAEADELIGHYGAGHGASVFGIAATRPTQIAQDIPAMAEHVDYICPMVYYSHWGPGEYEVPDPNADPYAITHRSLQDFIDSVDGKRARVIPWLQDFQLGGPHGEPQVREQLRATADAGIDEWIMWDPSVRYTTSAYDVLPEPPEGNEDVDAPGDGGVVNEGAGAEAETDEAQTEGAQAEGAETEEDSAGG